MNGCEYDFQEEGAVVLIEDLQRCVEENGGDVPETLCARCPKAVWMASDNGVQCFCRFIRHHTYDSTDQELRTKINICNGYDEAVLGSPVTEPGE